jgi:hypothetical protein
MAPHTPSFLSSVLLLALSAGTVRAASPQVVSAATLFTGPASPIVDLGYAKFQGKDDNVTNTHNYLGKTSVLSILTHILLLMSSPIRTGMPFANAPRFEQSSLITQPLSGGVQDASDYGPACPQHEITSLAAEGVLAGAGLDSLTGKLEGLLLQPVLKESEDCLNINVQVPRGYEGKALPVVLWM